MIDVKENDEAFNSNSCPKEDAAQVVLTPETVTITSKDDENVAAHKILTPKTVTLTSKDDEDAAQILSTPEIVTIMPKDNKDAAQIVSYKSSEMVFVDGDKPESSSKKTVESMGMVFMCNSKTKANCFRYRILGLPAGKKGQVAKIYKGMRLFLYDVDMRLMYGVFKAAGAGGYNIEPKAFNSKFPSQVRFTVTQDCLPLAEEKFRTAIKENYYTRNKFKCQLNAQQVKNLCRLFVAAKSGPSTKVPFGSDESHKSRDKRKRWDRVVDRKPRPRLGRKQRRYPDYDYGQPSVRYEREAVHPVARYHPPPQLDPTIVRSYDYETKYSYARDPDLDHRSYNVLEPEPRLPLPVFCQDTARFNNTVPNSFHM